MSLLLLLMLACRPQTGDDKADDTATDTDTPCAEAEFFVDGDGDGFGAGEPRLACEAPAGTVEARGDCDDTDADAHPGAQEDCTLDRDLNCDGSTGYADEDEDGWPACEDCDDSAASINPDAVELCDFLDNDCDGETDEDDAQDARAFHVDADGDTFGDPESVVYACERPDGAVQDDGDCDDTDAAVHPGAEEVCDAKDDDCDGVIGETLIPTDIGTIQGALDQAVDGDAFCVEAGTYVGGIDFLGKSVTLQGAGGSAAVTLDAQADRGVLIEGADGAVLEGFTLLNGRVSGDVGAAILVEDSTNVVLRDLDIRGAAADGDDGGIVAVWVSSVIVDQVSVSDCESFNDSDAGYLLAPVHFYGSSYIVTDLSVTNTTSEAVEIYGGALMSYISQGTMERVELSDNSLVGDTLIGSALFVYGSDDFDLSVTLTDLTVSDNEGYASSIDYGAVMLDTLDEVELFGAHISSNIDEAGVGVYGTLFLTDTNSATLENVALVGNSTLAAQVLGGVIFNDRTETEASNLILAGNTAGASSILYGMVLDFHPDGATSWTNVSMHGNLSDIDNGGTQYSAGWTCIDVNTDLVNVSISGNASAGSADSGAITAIGLNNDSCDVDLSYSSVFDNDSPSFDGLSDPTGSDGNLSVDPDFTDVSGSDPTTWDLSLAGGSALIDAGEPALSDPDGSTSDIGAYGGPGAADW